MLAAFSLPLVTGLKFPVIDFMLYYVAPLLVFGVPLAFSNLWLHYKRRKTQFYYTLMQWPFVLVAVGGFLILRLTRAYNNPNPNLLVGIAWFLADVVPVVLAWWNWVGKPYRKWAKLTRLSTTS